MNWKIAAIFFASFFSSLLAVTCSQPVLISASGEDGKMASVAINTRGDFAVAWIGKQKFQEDIRAALKDSQGQWSYPAVISGERENMNPPSCFLDDEGGVYVLWKRWIWDKAEYVQKPPGHDWISPIPLNLNMRRYCNVVFNRKGELLFLSDKEEKNFFSGKNITAQVHIKKPNYSEENILTPPGAEHGWFDNQKRSCGASIGCNSFGDVFVIWKKDLTLTDSSFQGSWLLPDGSFANTEEISANLGFLDSFLSGIAIDDRKNIAIVGVKENKIQALTRINDQWSDWISLSKEDKKKGSWFMPRPQVAVDGAGNILVVWKTENENETYIEGAYKVFQQEWIFLEKIVTEGKIGEILLRSDNKETFLVAWEERKDRKNSGIYAVEFSNKQGMWSSILLLSPESEFCTEPSLEFSKNGQGILAWTKKDSSFDSHIEVVELSLGP